MNTTHFNSWNNRQPLPARAKLPIYGLAGSLRVLNLVMNLIQWPLSCGELLSLLWPRRYSFLHNAVQGAKESKTRRNSETVSTKSSFAQNRMLDAIERGPILGVFPASARLFK
jgi:hypothetical protein